MVDQKDTDSVGAESSFWRVEHYRDRGGLIGGLSLGRCSSAHRDSDGGGREVD